MSGKSTYFEGKKFNKSNFYKNKNLFKIEKNHMVQKIHLNTSLDII